MRCSDGEESCAPIFIKRHRIGSTGTAASRFPPYGKWNLGYRDNTSEVLAESPLAARGNQPALLDPTRLERKAPFITLNLTFAEHM